MRKDELVHLHGLLTVLRAECERRGMSPEAFAAYDELDVSPMTVYGSKAEHATAVQALTSALAAVSDSGSADSSEGDATAEERNATASP
jgi:hypothetical protein